MSRKNPSYIFKSKHGVYYFQLRITLTTADKLGITGKIYRKSLRTKDRKTALMLARKLWLELNYNNFVKYIMSNKKNNTPSQAEQELILNELQDPHRLELIGRAIEVDKKYSYLLKSNGAYAELYMQNLGYHDSIALEYVSKNDIDLTDYYTPEPLQQDTQNDTKPLAKTYTPSNNIPKSITLTDLYDEFIEDRKTNRISPATQKAYQQQIGLFIDLLKNKYAHLVDKQDIRYYKRMLEKLPKNRKTNKRYKNLSFKQIEQLNLDDNELLSPSSKSGHVVAVKTFIKWATLNDYLLDGLSSVLEGVYMKRDQKHFATFDDNDLQKLFNSYEYSLNKFRYSWQYWTPLLALFTGARQNELCQLHLSDIKISGSIYYIDINDDEDKHLKNKPSRRCVPIHQQLIELGFVQFIESQKAKKQHYLFSDFSTNDKKRAVSRWFNERYIKKYNIVSSKEHRKTFHSFRRTCTNALKQHGIPEEICAEILGHQQKITFDTYSDPLNIAAKYDYISKLKYPSIDFSKIRLWRAK